MSSGKWSIRKDDPLYLHQLELFQELHLKPKPTESQPITKNKVSQNTKDTRNIENKEKTRITFRKKIPI